MTKFTRAFALLLLPTTPMYTLFTAIISITCVFEGRILFTIAEETCESHYECDWDSVCCKSLPHARFNNASNTKRCQPKLDTEEAAYRSRQKSCFGYNCSSDDDCTGRRYGEKLCCQENVCTTCPRCNYNSDCGPLKYCCPKSLYRPNTFPYMYVYTRCGSSCVGEYCTSHADCGNDCCRSERCVECSGRCKTHSECSPGQYCCGSGGYDNPIYWQARGKCSDSCIGDFCYNHRDCAGYGECCKSNKCFKCPICRVNSQCESGKYCCAAVSSENAACETSCVGYECFNDDDCGPPDECCISRKCVKCGNLCNSNSHCFNGATCCKGLSLLDYNNSKCASNCIGRSCVSKNDCNQSGIWCDQGKCSRTKTCKSTSDCGIMNNEQYYCCISEHSGPSTPAWSGERRMCEYSCIYHPCNSNSDCVAPDQCCSSENICTYKEFNKCPTPSAFPTWGIVALIIGTLLIVAVIVCLCYRSHKPKQQRGMRRASDEDSCYSSRRMPNNDNLPLELPESLNPQEHSLPLPSMDARHNPSHATNNEVGENELVSNVVNGIEGIDEPNRHPPTYSLNDPLAPPFNEVHPRTMENPNMPPPPYSLNYYYFRNDPPPNYEE